VEEKNIINAQQQYFCKHLLIILHELPALDIGNCLTEYYVQTNVRSKS
jgi:hypothetical protein